MSGGRGRLELKPDGSGCRKPAPTATMKVGAGPGEGSLRAALMRTLHQLREILHRRARLSSRAQALDEVSRLFFAHVVTALHHGSGISVRSVLCSEGDAARPAEALGRFVEQAFRAHLPDGLAHALDVRDFSLSMKPNEHVLAQELIACF